jgi:hypothetical protein
MTFDRQSFDAVSTCQLKERSRPLVNRDELDDLSNELSFERSGTVDDDLTVSTLEMVYNFLKLYNGYTVYKSSINIAY